MVSSFFFGFLVFGPIIGLVILIFAYFSLSPRERRRYGGDLFVAFANIYVSIYPSALIILYILDVCGYMYGVEGVHSFEGLLFYVWDRWGPLATAVSLAFVVAFVSIALGGERREKFFAYVGDDYLTMDGFVVRFYGLSHRVSVGFDVGGAILVLKTLDMIVSGRRSCGFLKLYSNVRRMQNIGDRDSVGKLRYGWERRVKEHYLRFMETIFLSMTPFFAVFGILFVFAIGFFYEIVDLFIHGEMGLIYYYFGLFTKPRYPVLWLVMIVILPFLVLIILFLGGVYVFRLSRNDEACRIIEGLIVKIIGIISRKTPKTIRLSLFRVYDGVRLVERIEDKGFYIVEIPARG